jgi:hypothetical protein
MIIAFEYVGYGSWLGTDLLGSDWDLRIAVGWIKLHTPTVCDEHNCPSF